MGTGCWATMPPGEIEEGFLADESVSNVSGVRLL